MRLDQARILVIDDHEDLVENLREILEEEGASVQSAPSASRGIALANRDFDVALVDVRLPDARGLNIVPRLKGGDGLQEILLVTGHASMQDAIEAVKAGAFAYILKPFDSEDLISTVGRALDKVRLRRESARLQRRLQQNEEALRTMVDTVQALLLVLDEHCVVQQANPAVAAATGRGLESILGRSWVDTFVPPRERERVRKQCTSVGDGESLGLESAVIQEGEHGVSERVVSWRLSGLRVGEEFRLYASGLDVTEIRDLENRTRLAEKLAAVGTISAGLAHEIRNPLNAAGLQLQLLERRLAKVSDDPRLTEPIHTVRAEIDRLSRLVTDFLSFAKPRALNVADLDIAALVEQVIKLQRPVAAERKVTLDLHRPEQPLVIGADGERLKQVIHNLVHNALDAVGEGGRVDVEVVPDGAGAKLVVRDDGPGIAPEIEARIFEPFFTTKEMGTGLGMAIAHKLVDQHGGTMTVDGRDGAEFTIHLPPQAPTLV